MPTNPPLRLSYTNGWICGVCGGIAERFGWKPNAVRAAYVLLSICSAAFPGFLLYWILYFLMANPAKVEVDERRELSG